MSMFHLPRRAFRRVVPLIALAAAATVGAVATATPAHAGMAECQLQYKVVSTWDNETAFQASVTVTNIGSTPTTSWSVLLDLPSDIELATYWSAAESPPWQMGDGMMYTFTNVSYNGAMAPGQQRSFGFLASGTDHYPIASMCSVS